MNSPEKDNCKEITHKVQYKILKGYILCKVNLCLWGKSYSDTCRRGNDVDATELFFFSQRVYNRILCQEGT